MRIRLVALAAIALTACGSQAGRGATTPPARSSTSLSASPTFSPSTSTLFAILETRRAGGQESEYAGAHDTVAIAGPDGYARAKATFTPRSVPEIPMAGAVLQPEAYVGAGAVYFIDGKGVVRRLDPSGSVRAVTTFAITSPQQAASFAVSPDGKQLMAALLTYPTVVPNTSANGPPFNVSGAWKLDIEAASDGSVARVVHHWEAPPDRMPAGSNDSFHNIVVAGWDDDGPLVMVDSYPGAQQTLLDGQFWAGGKLARLSADGTVGSPQGPANCSAYRVGPHGDMICDLEVQGLPSQVGVAQLDGTILWTAPIFTGASQLGGFAVSPDGTRIAMDGEAVGKNGSKTTLPKDFWTRGWLDDGHVIGLIGNSGYRPPYEVGVLDISSGRIDNWGFSGQFVGLLRS